MNQDNLNDLDCAVLGWAFVQLITIAYIGVLNRRRRRQPRVFGVHPINRRRDIAGDYSNLYVELREDPQHFYKYTRMSLPQFDRLKGLVEPFLPHRDTLRHRPIPTEMRLVITLRYLASGDLARTYSYSYRIGLSTCRAIIKEMCTAIYSALQPQYLAPPTEDEFTRIAATFWEKWNLSNCLGSIDGKHIRITAPPLSGSEYFNYKKYFSIILMAVCDANYCFTLVDIGHVGSLCDAGIFRQCSFGKAILDHTIKVPPPSPLPGTIGNDAETFEYYFVGDEAFSLKSNLMIPYSKVHVTGRSDKAIENKIFNYRLSRARRVIENTFGIMAARWRIFHSNIQAHPDTAISYVKAAVCLHNYLMKTKEIGINGNGLHGDVYEGGEVIVPGTWRDEGGNELARIRMRGNRNAAQYPMHCRDRLAKYLNTTGAVPWQFDYATRGMF